MTPTLDRQATVDYRAEVTVESIDHQDVTDKRYKMHFNDFDLARDWIRKTIRRYECNDKRIRLIAYRSWEDGPGGREMLGSYESKHTC